MQKLPFKTNSKKSKFLVIVVQLVEIEISEDIKKKQLVDKKKKID